MRVGGAGGGKAEGIARATGETSGKSAGLERTRKKMGVGRKTEFGELFFLPASFPFQEFFSAPFCSSPSSPPPLLPLLPRLARQWEAPRQEKQTKELFASSVIQKSFFHMEGPGAPGAASPASSSCCRRDRRDPRFLPQGP